MWLCKEFNFQIRQEFVDFFLNGKYFSVVVDCDFHFFIFIRVLRVVEQKTIAGHVCEMPFVWYCCGEIIQTKKNDDAEALPANRLYGKRQKNLFLLLPPAIPERKACGQHPSGFFPMKFRQLLFR